MAEITFEEAKKRAEEVKIRVCQEKGFDPSLFFSGPSLRDRTETVKNGDRWQFDYHDLNDEQSFTVLIDGYGEVTLEPKSEVIE